MTPLLPTKAIAVPIDKSATFKKAKWEVLGYTFICTSNRCTEEEAGKIVECTQPKVRGAKVQIAFYRNYEQQYSSYGSAVASLRSLLIANGLNIENNYALLIKNDA